jgi:hypothetical protein
MIVRTAAPVVDILAEAVGERGFDFVDRRQLPLLAARLALDSDQHVLRSAELLERDLTEAETAKRRAHRREIGVLARDPDLDQDAAAKVDPEIEALGRQQDQAEQDQSA